MPTFCQQLHKLFVIHLFKQDTIKIYYAVLEACTFKAQIPVVFSVTDKGIITVCSVQGCKNNYYFLLKSAPPHTSNNTKIQLNTCSITLIAVTIN